MDVYLELSIEEALRLGIEAHKVGEVQKADQYYTAILKAQPKHPDANHNMGVLAVGIGKVEAALPFFKAAVGANEKVTQFWLSYIDAHIRLDRYEEARNLCSQAKNSSIKDERIDNLETQIDLKLSSSETIPISSLLEHAKEFREAGKFYDAISLLLNNMNAVQQDAEALSLLSQCYILQDDLENAELYLSKAEDIGSDLASLGWNKSRLYLKKQKFPEALKSAKATNKKFPNDIEGIGVLGICLRANNKIKESLSCLDEAISHNSNYAEALLNRGLIYFAQNDKVRALSDLNAAYNLKPHIQQIWELLVNLRVELKKFEEAIPLIEKIITNEPNEPKYYATLALCHQAIGNLDKALDAYQIAIKLQPDNAEFFNNSGIILKQCGRINDAWKCSKGVT